MPVTQPALPNSAQQQVIMQNQLHRGGESGTTVGDVLDYFKNLFTPAPNVPNPAPDKAGVWGNEFSGLFAETKNNPQMPDYNNLRGEPTNEWKWLVDMFADKPEPAKPNPLGMAINGALPSPRKRGPGATPSSYTPMSGVRG